MNRRVVVTGLGVVSPNGLGVPAFLDAIRNGVTGIRYIPRYEALKFNCQVAGIPQFEWELLKNYVSEVTFHGLQGQAIAYGLVAAADAWRDAIAELPAGNIEIDVIAITGDARSVRASASDYWGDKPFAFLVRPDGRIAWVEPDPLQDARAALAQALTSVLAGTTIDIMEAA